MNPKDMALVGHDRFRVGDRIALGGVLRGGVIDESVPSGDPRCQSWRVKTVQIDGDVELEPLHPDGTLDAFNAFGGSYWIRTHDRR